MTIKIDGLVSQKLEFDIAGETKALTIDDKMSKKILLTKTKTDTRLSRSTANLMDYARQASKTENETYNKILGKDSDDYRKLKDSLHASATLSAEAFEKAYEETTKALKNGLINDLDEIFGAGFGHKCYEYYGYSTAVLNQILDIVIASVSDLAARNQMGNLISRFADGEDA